MTARNYHTPPQPGSTRARCPVCHEAVYSRAGIHPQCAVRQSEPPNAKAAPQAPAEVLEDMPAEIMEDVPVEVAPAVEVAAEILTQVRPASKRRPA